MTTANGKRILVLGGRGMLGRDLVPLLTQCGHAVTALDLPELDITSRRQLEPAVAAAEAVVNCAAWTNVDGAESNPAAAYAVNADAVGLLGRLAASRGIHVLHISTDFVFDGALDRPYREDDPPRPLSVYGASKLAGERRLAASGCDHAIVRVQWTYGAGGANFITKVVERARGQAEMAMVADQLGSPTWTADAAAALAALLDRRATGLYHYAAAGYATRFEVAALVIEALGLPTTLRPRRTRDFPSPAQRPLNSRFDCTRLDALLGVPRPAWDASLRRFLATLG